MADDQQQAEIERLRADIEHLKEAGDDLVKAVGALTLGSFAESVPVVMAMQEWDALRNK